MYENFSGRWVGAAPNAPHANLVRVVTTLNRTSGGNTVDVYLYRRSSRTHCTGKDQTSGVYITSPLSDLCNTLRPSRIQRGDDHQSLYTTRGVLYTNTLVGSTEWTLRIHEIIAYFHSFLVNIFRNCRSYSGVCFISFNMDIILSNSWPWVLTCVASPMTPNRYSVRVSKVNILPHHII